MATQQERAAKARDEKLAAIERQVKEGSLVIRKMTDAERAEHPAPSEPRRPRRKS
jgi:hypothetical protein